MPMQCLKVTLSSAYVWEGEFKRPHHLIPPCPRLPKQWKMIICSWPKDVEKCKYAITYLHFSYAIHAFVEKDLPKTRLFVSLCVFWKSLPTCGTSVFSIVKKADSWRNCPKRLLLFNSGALRPRLKSNSYFQRKCSGLSISADGMLILLNTFFLCVVIVVHILVCRCIAANLRKSVDVALWTSQKLLRLRFSSVYFYKFILFLSTFDCK